MSTRSFRRHLPTPFLSPVAVGARRANLLSPRAAPMRLLRRWRTLRCSPQRSRRRRRPRIRPSGPQRHAQRCQPRRRRAAQAVGRLAGRRRGRPDGGHTCVSHGVVMDAGGSLATSHRRACKRRASGDGCAGGARERQQRCHVRQRARPTQGSGGGDSTWTAGSVAATPAADAGTHAMTSFTTNARPSTPRTSPCGSQHGIAES